MSKPTPKIVDCTFYPPGEKSDRRAVVEIDCGFEPDQKPAEPSAEVDTVTSNEPATPKQNDVKKGAKPA